MAPEAEKGSSSYDGTLTHAWFLEPSPGTHHEVLTKAGLENIANHKYVPGAYTHLDNLLNPIWTKLTSLLPMWLAPNAVTTLGGMCCGASYYFLWTHSPNFDQNVPDWVVLLSGLSTIAYYTLDCMDGKQARRTGASSPLGQLFDHGFDCICNMAHCAGVGGYTMIGGTKWFMILQGSLQFSFFMAQWEEYYTHILPHSTGDWLGVTEVNYGLALVAIVMSFIDREAFWIRTVSAVLPAPLADLLPPSVVDLELRYAAIAGWVILVLVMCLLSLRRVFRFVDSNAVRFSAASKLLSPAVVGLAPFLLPSQYIADNTRYISVAGGLLFSTITKKMIVFSMAKMTYASIQMDILPFVAICVWIRSDPNLTKRGAIAIMGVMCILHAIRLVFWARRAINDICKRLGIWCLRIKPKEA
uniref:Uncharacterized protein n=2 Tax=Odontella aurita TaxID=265563 RepID=A0A7S4MXJ2_9STRA|mmetsp:Transcript_38590/g.115845  ORF Transcript_38590/g.115845 Transcript_38590/m.115845 type:complete len:414 (+) Transcript_38590:135-1376(+)